MKIQKILLLLALLFIFIDFTKQNDFDEEELDEEDEDNWPEDEEELEEVLELDPTPELDPRPEELALVELLELDELELLELEDELHPHPPPVHPLVVEPVHCINNHHRRTNHCGFKCCGA